MGRFKLSVNPRRIEFGVGMIQHFDLSVSEAEAIQDLKDFGFNFTEIMLITNQQQDIIKIVKNLPVTAHDRSRKNKAESDASTSEETKTLQKKEQAVEPSATTEEALPQQDANPITIPSLGNSTTSKESTPLNKSAKK